MQDRSLSTGKIIERMPISILDESVVDKSFVAETQSGDVLGYRHERGVIQFASIPFAAPPIGTLRFQPPTSVAPWEGVLDTREMGPSCIQEVSFLDGASLRDQSEDCLWLTLTTPQIDEEKRPVVVWIHGGALTQGGSGDPTYDGTTFSARGDLVIVNLQYRLGVLGWLDLSELGGEGFKDSKINGQLDVLAGLEWVQRNISNFGGDPENVTIMGESAGGYLVASLLRLPEAQHLFHKAILQSGVYDVWDLPVERQEMTRWVMKAVNATSLEELLQIDGQTIQRAQESATELALSKGLAISMAWFGFRGVTQEDFVRAAGYGKPILHGTLKDEYHLLTLLYEDDEPHKLVAYGHFGNLGLDNAQIDALVARFSHALPDREIKDVYVDITTAAGMHYPHILLSEAYSNRAPVYTYLIDWRTPVYPELGAYHSLDLPIVFGNFTPVGPWDLGDNPPVQLSKDMQDAWIAFARNGNPSHKNIPEWPVHDIENRYTMKFGDTYQVLKDPLAWVRDLGTEIDRIIGSSE